MAMTSFVGGGDAFAPFCSPTKLAPTSSRGGRDMHLDVVEVACRVNATRQWCRRKHPS